MSRSTPQRRLYCSVCKERNLKQVLLHEARTGIYEPSWFWVKVEGEALPGQAHCRCLNCGHTWVSASLAAKRELRCLAIQAAKPSGLARTRGPI